MAKTVLEKMLIKPEYSRAFLHVPETLRPELHADENENLLHVKYKFILAFYTHMDDLEKDVPQLRESLADDGLLWIAYPKGKALQTDLNRDILHAAMEKHLVTGVSLISIDATWSAMRFKINN